MVNPREAGRRPRPGGRSARIRTAVLAATYALLTEGGYDGVEVGEVARRAGVHPTTVYRRWPTKAGLVGEALLNQARPLAPTPDTGSLGEDLRRLLRGGASLVRSPAVRALFGVLLAEGQAVPPEVAEARDRFWAAHRTEAHGIAERAVARAELPVDTDPDALIDLVVGPGLLRLLLMGQDLSEGDIVAIVDRAIAILRAADVRRSHVLP